MAGSRASFTWNDGGIIRNLREMPGAMNRLIATTVELYASRGDAYMRKNARWKDRTTNARNGLHAISFHDGKQHGIIYAHGVPYGIWLEVRFSGKYAIIAPTLQDQGPRIMSTLNNGMARLKGIQG